MMDKQTDKQKLNIFDHRGSGQSLSPTKLGMVIEDLEHVLVPRKLLGYDTQFCSYEARKIWGNLTRSN